MAGSSADTIRQQLAEVTEDAAEAYDRLKQLTVVRYQGGSDRSFGKISHSPPPWNAAAAMTVLTLHQLARELEARLRICASQPVRWRGGSDANTLKALKAIGQLASAVDDRAVADALRKLRSWLSGAMVVLGELEFPQRLPRSHGQGEPRCPFCRYRTLRMKPLEGLVTCVNPACRDERGRRPWARMEYSGLAAEWVLRWQDGIIGVPVEEAAS